ncbi:MAG TPA: type II secretion system protein [Burkholderiales bacterium]|jgi:prepilin-type N-terminal cleavage/methylation domain-containing protein
MQLGRAQRGFTLTEMAVVFAIVALLIAGAMSTLSSQVERRDSEETQRRLNAATDAVIAFAIVNRRLPCPATAAAGTGDEALATGTTATGGACTSNYGGFLPGRAIGFQPVDASGYGLDAWGNRIRYAVANTITGCTGSSITPHFTSVANLKANGVSCQPNDLDICAPTDSTTACTAANRAVSTGTVAVILFSTGKNGALPSQGPHELANTDGNASFISHPQAGPDSATGRYDDLMVWLPAGVIYSKLIAAGALP